MGHLIWTDTLDRQHQFPAYCAELAGTPRAAIIVIQEIFGLNAGIRGKSDKWAEVGYLAVAPDLHWRFRLGSNSIPMCRSSSRKDWISIRDSIRTRESRTSTQPSASSARRKG